MKKKFVIGCALIALSLAGAAQSEKTDTVKPAKQVIQQNGEKDLPQQLKQKQLSQRPAILNSDTTSAKTAKPIKHKCRRNKSNSK